MKNVQYMDMNEAIDVKFSITSRTKIDLTSSYTVDSISLEASLAVSDHSRLEFETKNKKMELINGCCPMAILC